MSLSARVGPAAVSDDKTRILTADETARLAGAVEPVGSQTRVLSADQVARLTRQTAPDDSRTRVLSAEEAARLLGRPAGGRPPAEPRLIDGKIVFFCANGHRIVVDRALAGKRGACSKQGCGTPVVIPFPPGLEPPPVVEVPTAPEIEPAAEPAAEESVADVAEASPPVMEPAPPAAADEAALPSLDFAAAAPAAEAAPADEPGFDPAAAVEGWTIDIDEIDHPTARLVARLWMERAHGGVVEVHLTGGSVIMPEWYDPRWSCGSHALFAALAADGTVTLTAVAWDQIQKVVVRQVQGTPDGMFEG